MALVVLDEGPIPHAAIERYDDRNIEGALLDMGVAPETATYRLIEVDLTDLEDTRWFPGDRPYGTEMVERLRRGEPTPPVVVVQTDRGRGLGLLDGLNRLYAHWTVGRATIRAYELIVR